MQDEYVLDTETVRAFVGAVRAAMARTDSAAPTCDAIRPRFAELHTDDAWLPSELRAPAPESGMGGGIGRSLLYRTGDRSLSLFSLLVPRAPQTPVHDHLACGFVGLFRGAQDEVFAPRNGSLELVATGALAAGDFHALIPPQDDIHRLRTTSPEPSVSIHLLTNDGGCVWRHAYEVATGEAHASRSGYLNVDCT